MRKGSRNIAVGTLIAAGIGYAAGILTAPKSGKETRKDIQKAALNAKTEAEKKLKSLNADLNKLIDQTKRKGKTATKKAQAEIDAAVAKAQKAKQKVREVLSAIHEGDADDKDLQKAMRDATKSIEHLKTYIKKTDGKKDTK